MDGALIFIIMMGVGDAVMAALLIGFMYPDLRISLLEWPPIKLGRRRKSTWARIVAEAQFAKAVMVP